MSTVSVILLMYGVIPNHRTVISQERTMDSLDSADYPADAPEAFIMSTGWKCNT